MKIKSQQMRLKFLLHTTLHESIMVAPSNPKFRYSYSSNGALYFTTFLSKVKAKGHCDL